MNGIYPAKILPFSAILVSLFASSAIATSFTPYQCSTTTPETFDWSLDSLSLEDGYEIEQNLFDSTNPHVLNYANNITTTRHFVASSYARYLNFHGTFWHTETCCDKMTFKQGTGTAYAYSVDSSSAVTTNYTTMVDTLQHRSVDMTFGTDSSVTKAGFNIDQVKVTCQSTPGASFPANVIRPMERYTGILMHQDDVVNFIAYAPIVGDAANIAIWGPAGTNHNIDLYMRCGALPTSSTFDAVSAGAGMSEFLVVTNGSGLGSCSDPYALYLTVHNKGTSPTQFNLMLSESHTGSYRSLYVAVEGGGTAGLNQVRDTMLKTAKSFYGMTEGQIILNSISVTTAPAAIANGDYAKCRASCGAHTCDICFVDTAPCCGQTVGSTIFINAPSWGDVDVVTHELAHSTALLDVNDEHDDRTGWECSTCGHSVMANAWSRSNNLCIDATHTKDRGNKVGTTTPCSIDPDDAAWTEETYGLYHPSQTPDIYDFVSHGFNNIITVY